MSRATLTEARVPCNWCGLLSRPGSICEICGSPIRGAALLVMADEFPAVRKASSFVLRLIEEATEPEIPADGSQVACSWCGMLTRPGDTCELCGSPLTGGYQLEWPTDGSSPNGNGKAPAAQRVVEPADLDPESLLAGPAGAGGRIDLSALSPSPSAMRVRIV